MKKLLAISAASAVLIFAASTANADFYVRDDASGQRFIVDTTTNAETVLLLEENGAAPANCPAGSFYQAADGTIVACDGGAFFDLAAPEPGVLMPSGDPWPENAMLLTPRPGSDSGEQADPTSATESAIGAGNDGGTEDDGGESQ
jgi:hypothetical protein